MSLVAAGNQVFAFGGWRRAKRALLEARAAHRQTPGCVALLGPPNSGKSLLLKRTASVLRARGNTVHEAVGTRPVAPTGSQVLLIDNADALDGATLAALSTAADCFCVFAARPDFAARLQHAPGSTAFVTIDPLEPDEVAAFVQLSLAADGADPPTLPPEALQSFKARTDWYPGLLARAVADLARPAENAVAASPDRAAEPLDARLHMPNRPSAAIAVPETLHAPPVADAEEGPPTDASQPTDAELWPALSGYLATQPDRAQSLQPINVSGPTPRGSPIAIPQRCARAFSWPSWWQWPATATFVVFLSAIALAVERATTETLPPFGPTPGAASFSMPPLRSPAPDRGGMPVDAGVLGAVPPVRIASAGRIPWPVSHVAPAPPAAPDRSPISAMRQDGAASDLPRVPSISSAATPRVRLVFYRGDGLGERGARAAAKILADEHIPVTPPAATAPGHAGPGIRYFYDEDRGSAVVIQQALGPSFGASSLSPGDRVPGTIEVLVAGPHD